MARRGKKRVHHRRRRRMGAISGETANTLQMLAGVVGGAVANRFLDNIIAKQTTVKIDDKVLQFVKILGGAFLAYKMKAPLVKGIGLGIAGQSAVSGLIDMGVLKGPTNPANLVFPTRIGKPSQSHFPAVGNPVRPHAVGSLNGATYAGVYD